ncbi:beta-N-acetylhexosaminidase [Inquilinus sp. CAU 1745]|uniref:beta-N-acetylhexosaminidase n=1 Tax=Inquilinus sp. CAU 1745 TaxID=3140369 RepID=UPI00325BCB8A
MSADASPTRALILGCAGPRLGEEEAAFFRRADPLGFILFRRNCENPDQLTTLVRDLRASVGRPGAPVMIDQEGGRVQRLRPPHWPAHPPAAHFADRPEAEVRANAASIGRMVAAHGISVVAAPVLDLRFEGASDVVGDRSLGRDSEIVARLGRAWIEGFRDVGVTPVIKHLPGHGRARVDSHLALPVVDAPLEELEREDFGPFRRLADAGAWGLTAHIVFTAIDPDRPATLSPTVIGDIIRGRIGFDGILLSDDLSMGALKGSMGERVAGALAAGCDIALHCNGKMAEMIEAAEAATPLSEETRRRMGQG